jgi:hypothetical protein
VAGQLIVSQSYDNQQRIAHAFAWMQWRHQMMLWGVRAARIVLPAITLAAVFELMLARQRRRYAMRGQFCLDCGYDLRASDLRCPECGRPIDRPRSSPVRQSLGVTG